MRVVSRRRKTRRLLPNKNRLARKITDDDTSHDFLLVSRCGLEIRPTLYSSRDRGMTWGQLAEKTELASDLQMTGLHSSHLKLVGDLACNRRNTPACCQAATQNSLINDGTWLARVRVRPAAANYSGVLSVGQQRSTQKNRDPNTSSCHSLRESFELYLEFITCPRIVIFLLLISPLLTSSLHSALRLWSFSLVHLHHSLSVPSIRHASPAVSRINSPLFSDNTRQSPHLFTHCGR